jgi:hypothetical protein
VTRYYLGMPILVVSALEGWVLGYDPDGRDAVFWHDQLKATPWGDSP